MSVSGLRALALVALSLVAACSGAVSTLSAVDVPGPSTYPSPEPAPSVNDLAYGADYVPRHPAAHAGLDRDDGIPYGVHLSFAEDPRTTLTVTWFTAGQTPVHPALQWGRTSALLENTIEATTEAAYDGANDPDDNFPIVDVSVHSATIRGLQPGETVSYRVVGDSGVGFVYQAHTAPLSGEPVRVTFYGDHGVQAASKLTVAYLLDNQPDLIVILGDISYANGNEAVWDHYFDLYEPLYARVPVMPSTGNHEADDGTYFDAFRTRFTLPGKEVFYGFDYGNLHFTIIEGNGNALTKEPQAVLADTAADLMTAALRRSLGEIDFTFAVQHFPIYSNHHDRNFDSDAGTHTHVDNPALQAIEEPLFEAAQIDALLVGHNHHFERSRPISYGEATTDEGFHYQDPAGFVQVISGGGGQSLYDFQPLEEFADWSVHHAKAFHVTELRAQKGLAEFQSVVTSPCPPSFENCTPEGAQRGDVLDSWALDRPTAAVSASTPASGPERQGPVRFVLTGDTGEGNPSQYRVSHVIQEVCVQRGCDFMAILGDLIYEAGVASPYDDQFETKFEAPYANLDLPIYTVLGNHDNSYDPALTLFGEGQGIGHWYDSGRHMVAYHYRHDRSSDKWQMPDRYYSFRYGDAEFFALDSNTMMWNGVPTGTADPGAAANALSQGPWLQERLAASDAPWKFTLAHHPYASNGEHGDAGEYDDEELPIVGEQSAPGLRGDGVRSFFDRYVCPSGRVDLHLSGHDHDLQWLKPVDRCGSTEFIVSGAGAKSRALEEPTDDAWFGRGSTQGFFWVEVDGPRLRGIVYDEFGNVLFDRTLTKPGINRAPEASIAGPDEAHIDEPVTFDGSSSSDPDGTIVSYAWDLGDGTTASGSSVNHRYASSGEYLVALEVTDDIGATARTTHTIEVTETPGVVDPGFAYEDVDGDCRYRDGIDVPLADEAVRDGVHAAADGHGLVVPQSVRSIQVRNAVEFISNGRCLHIGTEVRSQQESLRLESRGGSLVLDGGSVAAKKDVALVSLGGDVRLPDASIASTDGEVLVASGGGHLGAEGARIASSKRLSLSTVTADGTSGGAMNLTGATVRSGAELRVDAAAVDASDAMVGAEKQLTLTSNGPIDLRRAELRSEKQEIVLDKVSNENLLHVEGVEIFEPKRNDKADVRPDHTKGVVGTPARGGLE